MKEHISRWWSIYVLVLVISITGWGIVTAERVRAIYVGYEELMKLRSVPYPSGFAEDRNGVKSFRGVKVVVVNEENYLEVY